MTYSHILFVHYPNGKSVGMQVHKDAAAGLILALSDKPPEWITIHDVPSTNSHHGSRTVTIQTSQVAYFDLRPFRRQS